jgi:hypothetical protein
VTGRWSTFSTASPASLETNAAIGLLVEANAVHAYSAITGAFATLPIATLASEANWSVAAVVEAGTGVPYLFSGVTGQWSAGPVSPLGMYPMSAFGAVLLQTSTGFAAFSGRTGRLVALAEAQSAAAHVNSQSGLLVVEGAQNVHVFDPRRDVWLSAPLPGGAPVLISIWRTSLAVRQGRRCFGFGTQVSHIDAFDLPEDEVNTQSSSESVSIATASNLVAYSPVPDLLPLAQFPEFRRMFADGTTLELQLRGEVGAAAAILVGRSLPSAFALPPLGFFFLDPGTMSVLWTGAIPFPGTAVVRLPLPVGLHGLNAAFQAGLLPPSGGAYLSRMGGLYIP